MSKLLFWAKRSVFGLILPLTLPLVVLAQEDDDEEKIYDLNAFAIEGSAQDGYLAQSTLAGSRVRTEVRDLGASIAIVTQEFMEDTGATDGESLLQFVGNVEVGGALGNFSNANTGNQASTSESRENPQRSQRIRGLISANLTRDYFQTDIPFDAYNTSRVTINRGPNSILFGLGSPGGIINNTTNKAQIGSEFGEISVRMDSYSGHRETLDVNKTLIKDRLAIRVNLMNENVKFRQEPAFEDDTRFFIAWDAVLLENEHSTWLGKTTFRGSFESGEINRNPPDVVPPTDAFSSWWNGLGTQEDLNKLLSVPGMDLSTISNKAINPAQVLSAISSGLVTVPAGLTPQEYADKEGTHIRKKIVDRFKRGNPLGNDPFQGGRLNVMEYIASYIYPGIVYKEPNAAAPGFTSSELNGIQGIMHRFRPAGFATQDTIWSSSVRSSGDFAVLSGPAGAGFGPHSLNNRNVFDYHKNMLAGTVGSIVTDFDIKQFFLQQDLFGGKAGIEIAWDNQSLDRETFTPLDNERNKEIYIDITAYQPPGDSNYDGIGDRLLNENVGRPVMNLYSPEKSQNTADQETFRSTVFGTLDFKEFVDNNKLGEILGSHTITGLFEDRINKTTWRQTRGVWWADNSPYPGLPSISNGLNNNFRRVVRTHIYLGPDVRGLSSPDDVRVDGYVDVTLPKVGDEYGIWYFDKGSNSDKQATWRVIEHVRNADVNRTELESKAISLQSRLFSDHIVGMWARRNDQQTVFRRLQHETAYGDPNGPLRPNRIDLPGINLVDGDFNEQLLFLEDTPISMDEEDTDTWSIVGRYPEVLLGDLPWGMDITGHYYEAESFQPAGNFRNVLNQRLPGPLGTTEEYGFTIELFERRLSIRFNRFETKNANAHTGSMNGRLGAITNRLIGQLSLIAIAENDPDTAFFPSDADRLLTPATDPNNTARISGTDADLIGSLADNDWEGYYDALIGLIPPEVQAIRNIRTSTREGGLRVIESDPLDGPLESIQDFVATGTEIDIMGSLTNSWSISLNVAQQETVTANTGPVAIPLAFKIREGIAQTIPGTPWKWEQLRDSPFQKETNTLASRYDPIVREMAVQRGKDNTVSQEQREWRINLTSRYEFLEGMLKGFAFGGSIRYQDEISAGYPNILDADGNVLPDIANPFLGPDSLDGDLFFRYQHRLTDKIDWRIQLNARNFYRSHGAKDIPVTINPDGRVALTRIPVEQQYFLTNTFSF